MPLANSVTWREKHTVLTIANTGTSSVAMSASTQAMARSVTALPVREKCCTLIVPRTPSSASTQAAARQARSTSKTREAGRLPAAKSQPV